MRNLFCLTGPLLITLTTLAHDFPAQTYQDLIVKGQCVQRGIRFCEPAYNAIKQILDSYKGPFSVLDVGAAQGYFSLRIAHEYPQSLCVMLEGDYDYVGHVQLLTRLCNLNALPNIMFVPMLVTPTKLAQLGKTEHFDIVLALNFIHHCGQDWKKITDELLALGNTLIVENAPLGECPGKAYQARAFIEQYLVARGAKIVAQIPRHTSVDKLSKIWIIHTGNPSTNHGIQKTTFQSLGGIYPDLSNKYLL